MYQTLLLKGIWVVNAWIDTEYNVDTRKSCIYLFIRRRRNIFRNIYLFTQIFIILLNVFIYLLAVGDEKYK